MLYLVIMNMPSAAQQAAEAAEERIVQESQQAAQGYDEEHGEPSSGPLEGSTSRDDHRWESSTGSCSLQAIP